MTRPAVAVIGECMVEVSLAKSASGLSASSLAANLSFGGDVLNTAVYLSRLGCGVDFVSAVGDDKISDWLVDQWQQEGVGCDLIERMPNQSPGMYMISTDASGERSFSYWRDSSPARKVFDDPEKAEALFAQLGTYSWLYFTGITLAILPAQARESLLRFVDRYRAAGGKVAFDSNFRPRLWPDRALAKDVFNAVYERTDLALLTIEDEVDLFGAGSLDQHVARLQGSGIAELVLKQGPEGCEIILANQRLNVPAQKVRPVDTTSAGDAFNAGYLAQRIAGKTPEQAAQVAHRLAAVVIQHPGAIVPKAVTEALEFGSA
ncbi:sugar kinase [Simiduia curdlanivorans]|uniref:Sugar kinase n=1 Tax=Simiduia curdlanivorans TaxID=1492769 RepID=A0ABV8V3I2_9GAMM|nr:sugar kinase [Simiduia curdlanivorans]MDN3638269.1 sugar kinase [Simiduia curdlanivorans]